jgi:dihydroflavonol-4-reductase
MDTVLLTGATGFLGYHVAKKLNAAGIRPRVLELREGKQDVLNQLDVHRCAGYLEDASAVRSACFGADTLLHLAFKVSVGSGTKLAEEM